MRPERYASISHYFKEEPWVDRLKLLNQVLAQEESTDNEPQAGTNKLFDVRSVFLIQRHCYWCVRCLNPFRFEVPPPLREFTKASNVVQHNFEFSVICRRQFHNQDPRKQV
jgi:hypothetical protein